MTNLYSVQEHYSTAKTSLWSIAFIPHFWIFVASIWGAGTACMCLSVCMQHIQMCVSLLMKALRILPVDTEARGQFGELFHFFYEIGSLFWTCDWQLDCTV